MPPLEALPTPAEEVLRRGVQSLTSFTSSHPPGPAWGSARSTLYPSLYCRVSSGFSLSPCTTGALAGARIAIR